MTCTDANVARGDDASGFSALIAHIAQHSGFRCQSYKERCLRRRIAVRMRARGVHTFTDYAAVLDRDEREWERLLDALTINVTKLYRNWDAYASLSRQVVPELWSRGDGELRVWSAGCSSGEEPYSIATLFLAHAEAVGDAGGVGRLRVLGTDIDRASLTAAAAGRYSEAAFADAPGELRERYFAAGYPASVLPEVRERVRFQRHDLLDEPPPHSSFHLIVCRNVMIYFDRASQERLLASFRDHLLPGGALFLGKVETLLGDSRRGFTALDPRERIFRRL